RLMGERDMPRLNGLRLVAVFKFAKAILLLAAGLGTLGLLHPDVANAMLRWSTTVAPVAERRLLEHLLARSLSLPRERLELVAAAAFAYAALFATEGTGLWLGRRWAEYLTLVATLSLVPIELVELARRPGFGVVTALILNLAVVAYLLWRIRARPGP
ncbi:MAG: DUF2127 domain-containing protein, partial [Gemmatimonadales bacterium]